MGVVGLRVHAHVNLGSVLNSEPTVDVYNWDPCNDTGWWSWLWAGRKPVFLVFGSPTYRPNCEALLSLRKEPRCLLFCSSCFSWESIKLEAKSRGGACGDYGCPSAKDGHELKS